MKKFLLFLFSLLFLTGCADMVELEDRAFVISIGIDKVDENYKVSLAIARAENFGTDTNMSFGTDDDKSAKTVLSSQAKTIEEAIKNIDTTYGKKIYLGHLKMCVFGKELLKDKQYFKDTILFIENNSDISKNILTLCAEKPADILNAKAKSSMLVALMVENYYKNNKTDTSKKLEFINLLNSLKKSEIIYIPLIKQSNQSVEISGLYEIKEYVFEKEISAEDTKKYLKAE